MKLDRDLRNVIAGISQEFLLSLFGSSKYINLLIDERGKVLWSARYSTHKHKLLLSHLVAAPLRANFLVPEVGDLNELFDRPDLYKSESFNLSSPPLTGKAEDSSGGAVYFALNSRNVLEAELMKFPFQVAFPLSSIMLFRLDRKCFLGVVRFSEFFQDFYNQKEQPLVVVDSFDRIMGYNRLFEMLSGSGSGRGLLGEPISDVLVFRNPDEKPGPRRPLLPQFEWKAGAPLPFTEHPDGPFNFSNTADGLVWSNGSEDRYEYLMYDRPFPIDGRDMDFEAIVASTPPGALNVVFRGIEFKDGDSQDDLGYSLTFWGHRSTFQFKKETEPVFAAKVPADGSHRDRTIKLMKRGNTFTFYIDGELLGRIEDGVPPALPCADRLYVFLRPGEKVCLRSLRIEASAESRGPVPGAPPLIAGFRNTASRAVYQAVFHPRIFDNTNFRVCLLTDITELNSRIARLESQRDELVSFIREESGLSGSSPAIRKVREALPTVARSNLTILIEGETGTGKDVLANAIHRAGPRSGKPFIKVDCGTIPDNLIESELFGHERGAFTGALAAHVGRFEQAQGGTLFLDEIGNLPLRMQTKLLSVLQDLKVQRVGGVKSIALDVRLIAATNVSLSTLISRGHFREDLFYRLNQFRFTLPPLRERREDIPILVGHFLKEANILYNKSTAGFDAPAMERLFNEAWPGNVRELRNAVLRCVLFCKGEMITAGDLMLEDPLPSAGAAAPVKNRRGGSRKKSILSKQDLQKALEMERGNLAAVTKQFGVSRFLIYKLLKKHGLKPDAFRE